MALYEYFIDTTDYANYTVPLPIYNSTYFSYNYTAIIRSIDEIDYEIKNSSSSTTTSNRLAYIYYPNGTSYLGDVHASQNSGTGYFGAYAPASGATIYITSSQSSWSNTDYYSHWYYYTAGTGAATGSPGQVSVRTLILPVTTASVAAPSSNSSLLRVSGISSTIEQGLSGQVNFTCPSALVDYLDGTLSQSYLIDDTNSANYGGYYTQPTFNSTGGGEQFFWTIRYNNVSGYTSGNQAAGSFFGGAGSTNGTFRGNDITYHSASGQYRYQLSINPAVNCPPGDYDIEFHFYDTTTVFTSSGYSTSPATGQSYTKIATGTFEVTAAAALDTTITLDNTKITVDTNSSSYDQGLTGGGSNTLYYALTSSSYTDGSNINNEFSNTTSIYTARTFSGDADRPFSTVNPANNNGVSEVTRNLPASSGNSVVNYIYAANQNGTNSTKLSNSYTVFKITNKSLSATKEIIPNGYLMKSNPTGGTSGATYQYKWTTPGGGKNSASAYDTGWQVENYTGIGGKDLGVGNEWQGTTWTCTVRGQYTSGASWVEGSSVSTTLPHYTASGPTNITEGTSGTIGLSATNGIGPIYYNVTPANQFTGTLTGTVGVGGSIGVTPTNDGVAESNSTGTVSFYINGSSYFNSSNLAASHTFNIIDPASTYSVAGPSGGTVNEGSNLTFTITTTSVANGTTVGWTLGGLNSGDYTTNDISPATIQNNSATVTFAIVNDNVADGNKTATLTLANSDSNGDSTGNPAPSASVTVVDTSNPGNTSTGQSVPATSSNYGLLIRNSGDTDTIIDASSRLTNILGTDSFNTGQQSSKSMFTGIDCSNETIIGIIMTWTGALGSQPTYTRSTNGITVTKNQNDNTSNTQGTVVVHCVRY